MSTITMSTRNLIELLATLAHTAADEPENHLGAVLLHGDRGYGYGTESGKCDLLVGTSSTGYALGHTYAPAGGRLHRPVLWAIDDVRAVIAAFRPKLKADRGATAEVAITLSGSEVAVAEAGQLDFGGDGLKVTFTERDLADYPRDLWRVLGDVLINPLVTDRTTGRELAVKPRTDFNAGTLEPFVKVAKLRKAAIELYTYHQHKTVLVQVGTTYRGALTPQRWDDQDATAGEGVSPDGEIYPPDLPPVPDRNAKSDPDNGPAAGILRVGSGVIIGAAPPTDDVPLADFPAVEPDPELLCQAAEIVIETQFGSASHLGRKLHVGYRRVTGLLEQLEARGVVGPPRGSKAREVLVAEDQLEHVLDTIRDIKDPQAEATAEEKAAGNMPEDDHAPSALPDWLHPCPDCQGIGQLADDPLGWCPACHGSAVAEHTQVRHRETGQLGTVTAYVAGNRTVVGFIDDDAESGHELSWALGDVEPLTTPNEERASDDDS